MLTSLGLTGAPAPLSAPPLSDFIAGERFSVPGVVTVRVGLSVVLRPLVAEGVEGDSVGRLIGGARLGETVRWVRFSVGVSVFRLLIGEAVSRRIEAVEYFLEVTGLDSGGDTVADVGSSTSLLLRKERRRMKGLETVSNFEMGVLVRKTYPMEEDLRRVSLPPAGGGPCLFLSMPCLYGSLRVGSEPESAVLLSEVCGRSSLLLLVLFLLILLACSMTSIALCLLLLRAGLS